jgi:DNA-binding transcriptional regulator LsrR (DeoR family)
MVTPSPAPAPRPDQTLSKATVRAAQLLGLTQSELAPVLGLSRSTVSRLVAGDVLLSPEQKAWELAALFVRLFRSLDAVVGPNAEQARAWLDSENAALAAAPRQLIATTEGLVRVVQYLDAARGRV